MGALSKTAFDWCKLIVVNNCSLGLHNNERQTNDEAAVSTLTSKLLQWVFVRKYYT